MSKIEELNNKALDIIANRGLDFKKFFASQTYYDYNMSLSCTQTVCKRVSANEYLILKAIIKQDKGLLEVLLGNKHQANEEKYIAFEYKDVELTDVLVQVEWTYWFDDVERTYDYEIEIVKVLDFKYTYEEDEVNNFSKEELEEFIYKELYDENSKIFKELMEE